MHRFVSANSPRYLSTSAYRLVSLGPESAVPQPSASIFRVDFIGGSTDEKMCVVKWPGELPSKRNRHIYIAYKSYSKHYCKCHTIACKYFPVPDLMLKINKSINERLFNDVVLAKHLTLLVEEWKKLLHNIETYRRLNN